MGRRCAGRRCSARSSRRGLVDLRAPSRAGGGLLSGLLLAEAIVRCVEGEGWTGYDLGRTALRVTTIDLIVAGAAPILLMRRDRARAYGVAIVVGVTCAAILALVIPLVRDAATG